MRPAPNRALHHPSSCRAGEGSWPIQAYSVHPGVIPTPLDRHMGVGGYIYRAIAKLPFVPGAPRLLAPAGWLVSRASTSGGNLPATHTVLS